MLSAQTPLAAGIRRPTLVLDEDRARTNLDRMVRRAQRIGVRLRPHFKTHQSAAIGTWFRERGVEAITVSSVEMARYFAHATKTGWRDITVAVPVNPHEVAALVDLRRHIELGLLLDDPATLQWFPSRWPGPVRLWIKVDVGSGRAGIAWDDANRLAALAEAARAHPDLELAGLLSHAGHTYHAAGPDEVRAVHRSGLARLIEAQGHLVAAGFAPGQISIGDTPGCSLAEEFGAADEIRPGNFIFYDLMQLAVGACRPDDLALAVLCPVTGKYPRRGQLNLYGGAVHFSKEALAPRTGPFAGRTIYGYLIHAGPDGLGALETRGALVNLSQEHGTLETSPDLFERIQIGDWVAISPVHACLTANLYREYRTFAGGHLPRLTSVVAESELARHPANDRLGGAGGGVDGVDNDPDDLSRRPR